MMQAPIERDFQGKWTSIFREKANTLGIYIFENHCLWIMIRQEYISTVKSPGISNASLSPPSLHWAMSSIYQIYGVLQRRKEGLHRSVEAFFTLSLKLWQNGTKNEKMIGLEREGVEQWAWLCRRVIRALTQLGSFFWDYLFTYFIQHMKREYRLKSKHGNWLCLYNQAILL